jgi:hypothetical protein
MTINDADGHRIEAAEQFGFSLVAGAPDDAPETYVCTEAQVIAFAKACERAGFAKAAAHCRHLETFWDAQEQEWAPAVAGAFAIIAENIEAGNALIDAELAAVRAPMGGLTHADIAHGFHLFRDGADWCAVGPHFENLAISVAGFGKTQTEAVATFCENLRASKPQFYRRHALPNLADFKVHE